MSFCENYRDMKKTSSEQDKVYMEKRKNNLPEFAEYGSGSKTNHEPSFGDNLTVSLGTNSIPSESNSGTESGNKKNSLKESTGSNSVLENNISRAKASELFSFVLSTNIKGESSLTERRSNKLNFLKEDEISSLLSSCNLEDDPLLEETENKFLECGFITPEKLLPCTPRKKLLVLDLNGFLVDIVNDYSTSYRVQQRISGKPIFKRPFCDDFLKFCFEKFDIGIWSSRRKYNVESVVDYLMGEFKHKLLFCWDQSKCTDTGVTTLENRHKPLVLKELKKLWNKEEFGLPWVEGEFSPSNTLLLDDSPYKALLNPPHTAIFPRAYHYNDLGDNSLGPGGDIRAYLEQLAVIDDVQHYVKEHPFGQPAVTASNPHWNFYSKIISRHATP